MIYVIEFVAVAVDAGALRQEASLRLIPADLTSDWWVCPVEWEELEADKDDQEGDRPHLSNSLSIRSPREKESINQLGAGLPPIYRDCITTGPPLLLSK